MKIKHDPFFRSLFTLNNNAAEFLTYLKKTNEDLEDYFKNVDLQTLKRMPSDYSNTEEYGYADLAFTAKVKGGGTLCIGVLMEHKSFNDDNVFYQLYKYHFHLMRENIEGCFRHLSTVALIIYNGNEKWNPLEKLFKDVPKELQPYILPFKTKFVDVSKISEQVCEQFNPTLALGLFALKYIWDFEKFRPYFEKYKELLKNTLKPDNYFEFIHEIDVYFKHKVSTEYKEAFTMDFVKPPYKTIWDSEMEEAQEKGLALGIAQGIKKGIEQGIEQGKAKEKREIAKAMLANGLSVSLISKISGLLIEEIKTL